MDRGQLEECTRELQSSLPILGAMVRRAACRKLAADGGPEAVPALAAALHSADPEVQRLAEAALRRLQRPEAVAALCALWARGREPRLAAVLAGTRYVPPEPAELRVLCALQADALRGLGEAPEDVPLLLAALEDADEVLRNRAGTALRSLRSEAAVAALCALWVEQRELLPAALIAECGYVAAQPPRVRLLSALQADAASQLGESPETVRLLVTALSDPDELLRGRAAAALRSLQTPAAVDALCECVIAAPASDAAPLVTECDYQHSDVSRRCLVLLLSGQTERYLELDFELQYARAEYRAGGANLRHRLAEFVRRSGDTRLLPIVSTPRGPVDPIHKQATDLTEREAEIAVEVYSRERRWAEVLALLVYIPLATALKALAALARSGWQPEQPGAAELLRELLACQAQVGRLPEPVPPEGLVLGPVLGEWLAAGQGAEWADLPTAELQRCLREEGPPAALAALAALGRRGAATTGDLEVAGTHPNWLVRLGSLVLGEIAPQLLFTPAALGGVGGGLWLERFGPYLADLQLPHLRAGNLNPDQVEALQAAGAGEVGGDWRAACSRLLCALASHHLRHAIEIEEGLVVHIEATDIEVEE